MAPWAYYWIDFNGKGVENLLAACGFLREKPYIYVGDNANNICNLLHTFAEEYDGSSLKSLSCLSYTLLLFQRLIQYNYLYEKRFVQYNCGSARSGTARRHPFCLVLP